MHTFFTIRKRAAICSAVVVVLIAACVVGAQDIDPETGLPYVDEGAPPPVEPQPSAPVEPAPAPEAVPPPPAPQQPAPAQPEAVEPQPVLPDVVQPEPKPAPQPQPRVQPVRPVRPANTSPVQAPRPGRRGLPPAPRGTANSTASQAAPPTTPAPETNGQTPNEPISFDFREAPLYDVIEAIARLTGRNFDVDPNIGATTVTLITHDKIPPEMAYQVLESILASRGFSMVETLDGHLIKILPTQEVAISEKTPFVKGSTEVPPAYDQFATHVIPIKYADAADLASALKLLGSKNARIDTYAPSNTLIITDTADGLRRIFSFIEDADVPGNETSMEIFTLEYARAATVAQQIEQVLLDTGQPRAARPGAPQPQRAPQARPARPVVPGAATNQVIGSREEVLRMVPDDRLNSLIVVATAGMMEKVRDLIKRLDTPTPYEANNLHIYELLNADAEAVEKALQPLIGSAPRRQASASGGAGQTAGGQAAAATGGGGGGYQTDVQPFEQKVQVTRYDQTNSLLIVASPQDYKLLESFIARLDVPQRQVHVEAVVMDVTLNNNFSLSVDVARVTGNDGFGVLNTSTINELAAGLRPAADAANQIVAGPRAALAAGVIGLGQQGGITAGVFEDFETTIGGKKVKIPFVPLLFQAIEQLTDVEVLSQPSLVTVDNEEASITVGQEVPFITSTSRPLTDQRGNVAGGAGFYGGGFTRVERQDVGVKLKVKPQISEGDYVLLETELEVSDLNAPQIGTVDILGPTTNKSLVKNKVVVKDGATAVMAGLIRDSATRKRNQAPILGDIPVLGSLFGKRSSSGDKRNMVVLVTPHIIKEGTDLERVTQYKVEEYHDSNIDALFKSGFFKKVKQKAEMRKNHRPTFNRSEELRGERAAEPYGRGDIPR